MIADKLSMKKAPQENLKARGGGGSGSGTKGAIAAVTGKDGAKKSSDDADDNSVGSFKSEKSFTSNLSDETTEGGDRSEIDSALGESQKGAGFAGKLQRLAVKGAKAVVRTVLDYGPPYSPKFDVALINECARPAINYMELHNLLNQRINPNLPDPDDLYYTPMHWCARNGHLLGIKMLRRAGAKINITNELGVTPLDLIVMMRHSPDRRKTQIKVTQYLLANGANVNNIDKGGYSAIDHAAVNNDLELINLLLAAGAKLRRENRLLVAKRRPILDLVHDPDCYRTLYEALLLEEREANQKRLERERHQRLKNEEKYYEQLHVTLNKRKERREQRDQAEANALHADLVLADRLDILQKELEQSLKEKEVQIAAQGVWRKVDDASRGSSSTQSHWRLELKTRSHITGQMIYDKNLELMRDLKQRNDVQQYNPAWRKLTGGGALEVTWPRAEAFALPGDQLMPRHARSFTPGTPAMTPSMGSSSTGIKNGEPDIFYMNEHDQALQDEDSLEDLLSDLQSL